MTELIVEQHGVFVGKHSERIRVTQKGQLILEQPLLDLDRVLILGRGVGISSDVIRECAERGVPISFVSGSRGAYAQIVAPGLAATVRTRREQILAFNDARGAELARAFACAKLQNQANLLKYLAKNRRLEAPDLYEDTREAAFVIEDQRRRIAEVAGATADAVRDRLLVLEAAAGKRYWEAVRALVRRDYAWEGRRHEGAQDLVNCLLNYAYAVLYGEIERAILLAGLDAYAGFIHTDRPGKPSLVLDLIEEFRQMVVDRTVLGLLNRGSAMSCVDGRLDDPTRRLVAERVLERLATTEPYEKKRHVLRSIVQQQARHLASYLRGDRPAYTGYVGRW